MIQNIITETKALLVEINRDHETDPRNPGPDSRHPGVYALGTAVLGLSTPATTRNVREHVEACVSCQRLYQETLMVMVAVAADRNRFQQEAGVRIHLVSMYRSSRSALN